MKDKFMDFETILKSYIRYNKTSGDEKVHILAYRKSAHLFLMIHKQSKKRIELLSLNADQQYELYEKNREKYKVHFISGNFLSNNIEKAIKYTEKGRLFEISETVFKYSRTWPPEKTKNHDFIYKVGNYEYLKLGFATHLAAGFDILYEGRNFNYIHFDSKIYEGAKSIFNNKKKFIELPDSITESDINEYFVFNELCKDLIAQYPIYNLDLTRIHNLLWHYQNGDLY